MNWEPDDLDIKRDKKIRIKIDDLVLLVLSILVFYAAIHYFLTKIGII